MKNIFTIIFTAIILLGCSTNKETKVTQGNITMDKETLLDKIKGGWAGQTIGVTFGGPYEFRYEGSFIGDYQKLGWEESYLKENMENNPGLYDDLYMDLTFVDVFEKYGIDAPADSHANAIANAGYWLWHANQAARYNILNGIKPPQSGHWHNNPHADCIDYQIESDFAGLMSPGMPNAASEISDKIGHIMNYGDGWYGGVYVGAMYSLAFISQDVNFVVTEALKAVPQESKFYQCINDVISWHKKYPGDWKQTWFEVQKKWAGDIGCPEGVYSPFNIDATVNAAYVVIGLLYGEADFTKSLEISTRCGQDADCNPSTVGGILGTMFGYSGIPEYWKKGLTAVEDMDFKYTTMSLNDVYEIGMKHALENIKRNGGTVNDNQVVIPVQNPIAVKLEKSFEGLHVTGRIPLRLSEGEDKIAFNFTGTGFTLHGEAHSRVAGKYDHVFNCEVYVDGNLTETPKIPVDYVKRRYDLCWNYQLPKGNHSVEFRILNPTPSATIGSLFVITYSAEP